MIDPNILRNDDTKENYKTILKKRSFDLSIIDNLTELQKKRADLIQSSEALLQKKNSSAKNIGKLKAEGRLEEMEAAKADVATLGDEIKAEKEKLEAVESEYNEVLITLPNILQPEVPEGEDEESNKEIRVWGEKPNLGFQAKPHYEILEDRDYVDFERGVKLSGSRFYVYNSKIAKLERDLINFMLTVHGEKYQERFTPVLVKNDCMLGTGQFPKFKDDFYSIERDQLNLIPTAEVTLTNLYANEILNEEELPIYLTTASSCFRRESGSAGKDTRGLIRVHQFQKVELVKFVKPETSAEELETLTQDAESILQKFDLHYRVVVLCSGDLSVASSKTYDLEVFMPGLDRWLEISSCSNFESYQSRRAKIRYKNKETKKNEFVYTLNASGVAAGRLMAALIENYQTKDGDVDFDKIYSFMKA